MLAPGADPAVSFALMTTQQDLTNLTREYTKWNTRPGFNFPALAKTLTGDALQVFRWDADIRLENAVTELMQPIRMSRLGGENDGIFMAAHENKKWPIFKLVRPPRKCFEDQVDSVYQHIDLRPERLNEITSQIGIPMQFWASILDLNPVDHHYTLELLTVALAGLSHVNQYAKHTLACQRPVAYSPSIQPIINPRRFAAFPSGHAAEAFLIARLLQAIAGQPKKRRKRAEDAYSLETHLQRLAARIADNRVVAGVHFPIDSTAGRMVGECFADYFLFRCSAPRNDGSPERQDKWQPREFNGRNFYESGQAAAAARRDTPFPLSGLDTVKYKLDFDPFEAFPDEIGGKPSLYFSALPISRDPIRSCIGVEIEEGRGIFAGNPAPSNAVGPFETTSILYALWKRVEAEWQHQTDWKGDFSGGSGGNPPASTGGSTPSGGAGPK